MLFFDLKRNFQNDEIAHSQSKRFQFVDASSVSFSDFKTKFLFVDFMKTADDTTIPFAANRPLLMPWQEFVRLLFFDRLIYCPMKMSGFVFSLSVHKSHRERKENYVDTPNK